MSAGGSTRWTCDAFVHVGERVPASHVSGIEMLDMKSRRGDQIVDLAVEVTAAAQAFPARGEPILPAGDCAVGSKPVLDKQYTAVRTKHPLHFPESREHIGYRAQGPGRHNRVENSLIERKRFGRSLDQNGSLWVLPA